MPSGLLLDSCTTLRPALTGDSKPAITPSLLLLLKATWLRPGWAPSRWLGSHQLKTRKAKSEILKRRAPVWMLTGLASAHWASRGWLEAEPISTTSLPARASICLGATTLTAVAG